MLCLYYGLILIRDNLSPNEKGSTKELKIKKKVKNGGI